MEPASVIDPVALQEKAKEHSATFSEKLSQILADPKKTLYLMVGLGAALALIFIIFVTVSQIFTANNVVSDNRNVEQENSLLTEQVDKSAQYDKQRKNDIDTLNQAINSYRNRNDHFPESISALIPDYLRTSLTDPESKKQYFYRVSVDFSSYEVWAVLSDGEEYRRSGS